MRSYLLCAPHSDHDLDAALASGADALVLDLGERWDDPRRPSTREAARRFLLRARALAAHPALFVRAAPLDEAAIDADLEAAVRGGADGVFLAQACGGASVQRLSAKLAVWEAECGRDDGATRIVAMAAETPAAIFELGSYAGASRRLSGLAFDADALRRSLGVESSESSFTGAGPVAVARSLLLIGARAAGVAAIDCALLAPDKDRRLAAKRDGFTSELTSFIREIPAINETFASAAATLY